jgi:hypothetical protein
MTNLKQIVTGMNLVPFVQQVGGNFGMIYLLCSKIRRPNWQQYRMSIFLQNREKPVTASQTYPEAR